MAKAGYGVSTNGAVALSAGVAKTILAVKSNAAFGLDLKKARIGFDGVSASAVPVLVQLCYLTWATGTVGTNSTSQTSAVFQEYGNRSLTHGVTAASAWTSEPTVLTPIDEILLTPNGGLFVYDFPLGDTPDCGLSEGFAIRCNAPAAVNARGLLKWERA